MAHSSWKITTDLMFLFDRFSDWCKRFWIGATEFTSITRPRDSTVRNVLLVIFWTTLGMLCNLSLPLATRLLVGACVLVMPWWTLAWHSQMRCCDLLALLPSFLRDLNIVMNSVGMVTWFASSLVYSDWWVVQMYWLFDSDVFHVCGNDAETLVVCAIWPAMARSWWLPPLHRNGVGLLYCLCVAYGFKNRPAKWSEFAELTIL
jgi:hypothetical protein